MPKTRTVSASNCSFCGEHKQVVPLIVTSNIKPDSACCSTCALAIVQQTQVWAYGVFREAIKSQKAPKLIQTPGQNAVTVAKAIEKATNAPGKEGN
jgi:hypothetical protein